MKSLINIKIFFTVYNFFINNYYNAPFFDTYRVEFLKLLYFDSFFIEFANHFKKFTLNKLDIFI